MRMTKNTTTTAPAIAPHSAGSRGDSAGEGGKVVVIPVVGDDSVVESVVEVVVGGGEEVVEGGEEVGLTGVGVSDDVVTGSRVEVKREN